MFLLRHTQTHAVCTAQSLRCKMCSISGIGAWSVSEWYAFNSIISGHWTAIVVKFKPIWSRLTWNFRESFSPNEPKLSEWVNDSLQLNRLQFRFKLNRLWPLIIDANERKFLWLPLMLIQNRKRRPYKVQLDIIACVYGHFGKISNSFA